MLNPTKTPQNRGQYRDIQIIEKRLWIIALWLHLNKHVHFAIHRKNIFSTIS